MNAITQVAQPILSSVPTELRVLFFERHIRKIMAKVGEPSSSLPSDLKMQYIVKQCCFNLLALAYSLLPLDEVHSMTGRVLLAFTPSPASHSDMTKAVIKSANNAKKTVFPAEEPDELYHARIQCNIAAYRALSASLLLTQNAVGLLSVFRVLID